MSKKLLLVEGNLAVQKSVEIALSKEQIEVVTVNNGLSALDILSKVPPDLLMVDSRLDGMDIHAFLNKIHGEKNLGRIPVLLLTDQKDLVDPEGLPSGVLGCIEKPIEADHLRNRVMGILQTASPTPNFSDAEETIIAPFSGYEEASPSDSSPDESGVKIEELLGWASSEEKSPFSELEEEKSSGDFNFPMEEEESSRGNEQAVLIDEEADAIASVAGLGGPENASPDIQESSDEMAFSGSLEVETSQQPIPVSEAPVEEPSSMGSESQRLEEEVPVPDPSASLVQKEEFVTEEEMYHNPQPEPSSSQGPVSDLIEKDPVESAVQKETLPALSEQQLEAILSKISKEVIEKVVWEVVPSLAEAAIKKEIDRIKSEEPS